MNSTQKSLVKCFAFGCEPKREIVIGRMLDALAGAEPAFTPDLETAIRELKAMDQQEFLSMLAEHGQHFPAHSPEPELLALEQALQHARETAERANRESAAEAEQKKQEANHNFERSCNL